MPVRNSTLKKTTNIVQAYKGISPNSEAFQNQFHNQGEFNEFHLKGDNPSATDIYVDLFKQYDYLKTGEKNRATISEDLSDALLLNEQKLREIERRNKNRNKNNSNSGSKNSNSKTSDNTLS